jgi:hypothetical protein
MKKIFQMLCGTFLLHSPHSDARPSKNRDLSCNRTIAFRLMTQYNFVAAEYLENLDFFSENFKVLEQIIPQISDQDFAEIEAKVLILRRQMSKRKAEKLYTAGAWRAWKIRMRPQLFERHFLRPHWKTALEQSLSQPIIKKTSCQTQDMIKEKVAAVATLALHDVRKWLINSFFPKNKSTKKASFFFSISDIADKIEAKKMHDQIEEKVSLIFDSHLPKIHNKNRPYHKNLAFPLYQRVLNNTLQKRKDSRFHLVDRLPEIEKAFDGPMTKEDFKIFHNKHPDIMKDKVQKRYVFWMLSVFHWDRELFDEVNRSFKEERYAEKAEFAPLSLQKTQNLFERMKEEEESLFQHATRFSNGFHGGKACSDGASGKKTDMISCEEESKLASLSLRKTQNLFERMKEEEEILFQNIPVFQTSSDAHIIKSNPLQGTLSLNDKKQTSGASSGTSSYFLRPRKKSTEVFVSTNSVKQLKQEFARLKIE